jgi:cystathionine beta-lyase/cystathionine gamma-synthase
VQQAVGQHKGYEYARTGNPTRTALEACLAALEGAEFGLAFASGMAAIDTLCKLLDPGDHVLAADDVYGGTFRLFDKQYARYGIDFSYADITDVQAVVAALRPKTRWLWLETPTNPQLKIADLRALAQAVHAASPSVKVIVDNTFATPYLQQPLALGCDVVVHSTTKYLGGHSDVVGGALVVRDPELGEQLAQRVDRRHARGKGQAKFSAFQRRQAGLQSRTRGVAGAGILVALVLAHRLLHVGGSLVDRRHHRARGRVGLLAGVDDERFDLVAVGHQCSRGAAIRWRGRPRWCRKWGRACPGRRA